MIKFLAVAARDARRDAAIKIARVAVAADLDPSTMYRFERGLWPGNADQVIAGYAEELELEAIVLWARALELWRAAIETGEADAQPAAPVVADVAARLAKTAGSTPRRAPARQRKSSAAQRRKSA